MRFFLVSTRPVMIQRCELLGHQAAEIENRFEVLSAHPQENIAASLPKNARPFVDPLHL